MSKHRRIVGLTPCWPCDHRGEVVARDWDTATTADPRVVHGAAPCGARASTLAAAGFAAVGRPTDPERCARGEWDERRLSETALSLVHRACHLRYLGHRPRPYTAMHPACVSALSDALLALHRPLGPDRPGAAWPPIARYAL